MIYFRGSLGGLGLRTRLFLGLYLGLDLFGIRVDGRETLRALRRHKIGPALVAHACPLGLGLSRELLKTTCETAAADR